MDVPKSIGKFLVAGEVIEKEFLLKGGKHLFATSKRLFIVKRNTVTDIDYQHISSVQIKQNRKWMFIILGVILFIAGVYLIATSVTIKESYLPLIFVLLGTMSFAFGRKMDQFVELTIIGRTTPEKFESATLTNLEDIFKLVREKRI